MGGGATQPNIFTDKKETSSNFTEPHNQNTLWDYTAPEFVQNL